MAELVSMQNIGKEIEKKLKSIAICSAEELIRLGSIFSFENAVCKCLFGTFIHTAMGN